MIINNTIKGSICVFGVFLFHFALGNINTFGNITPYMSSYMKFRADSMWIITGDVVWVYAAQMLSIACFMPIGGIVCKLLGTRPVCLISASIYCLSVILTYFTIQVSIWVVILTFGIGSGIGFGLGYSVSMSAAMKWFPESPGFISGILATGFGLGGFFFTFIQSKYINPFNIAPILPNVTLMSNIAMRTNTERYFFDDQVLNNIPMSFIVLGVIYLIMQLTAVLLMIHKEPQESPYIEAKELRVTDEKKSFLNDDVQTPSINQTNNDNSIMDIMKTKHLWLLFFSFFFAGFYILTVTVHYKAFGLEFINDDNYFTILGSVSAVINSLFRIVWGRIFDYFDYRITMSGLSILMIVMMGTFYFSSFIKDGGAVKAVYFLWVCILFIGQGAPFLIMPSATSRCFGYDNLATIYGFVFAGLSLASVIGAITSSFFFTLMQYKGQFILTTITSIFCLILTQFYREKTPKRNT